MCRFCGCPSNRLIARVPSGIVFLVPYPGFVDRFFEWFFAINCLFPPSDKACGCFAPARSFVFSFLWERRGRFFFIIIFLNTYPWAACLPVSQLRLNRINA